MPSVVVQNAVDVKYRTRSRNGVQMEYTSEEIWMTLAIVLVWLIPVCLLWAINTNLKELKSTILKISWNKLG